MSNAALASYRKTRAVELALTGLNYDQIALELGYANRGTAWRAVQSGLKERRFAAVDAFRAAELERLQRVEDQLWPRVLAGDVRACGGMRVVIDQRTRLLGLDQATRQSNRCTCDCPIHGAKGPWRPTLRPEDAPFVEEPSAAVVADIEASLERWADECGLWTAFQVLTAVGHVMELVARPGADEERA